MNNYIDWIRPLGISELNQMQKAMLNNFIANPNIILLSPTGSGKTLAYILPLFSCINSTIDDVQAIILVPSRELALQIDQVVKRMNTPFRIMSCYGGRPAMDEHRTMIGLKPHIIVGTPGRINDHLAKHNISTQKVNFIIIDEFDKCLEFGFHDEMADVINWLPYINRRILISATDATELPRFAGASNALKLDYINKDVQSSERLQFYEVISPSKDKLNTLFQLIHYLNGESTLIFCNHRESVERIYHFLIGNKVICEQFHGGLEQEKRERSLYKFQNESSPVLVCTDLAARGLDIAHVSHVVHYHLPLSTEGFIHRNGRTARWKSNGKVYIILSSDENKPDYLPTKLESFNLNDPLPKLKKPRIVTLYIGKGKKDKINKIDIVGFLSKKGGLTRDEIGRVDVKDHYSFAAISRNKCENVLKMLQGEKIKGIKTMIQRAK